MLVFKNRFSDLVRFLNLVIINRFYRFGEPIVGTDLETSLSQSEGEGEGLSRRGRETTAEGEGDFQMGEG